MRLVTGLCPDPLGSLQRCADPLAELKGSEWETGGEGREGEMEEEVKGRRIGEDRTPMAIVRIVR